MKLHEIENSMAFALAGGVLRTVDLAEGLVAKEPYEGDAALSSILRDLEQVLADAGIERYEQEEGEA